MALIRPCYWTLLLIHGAREFVTAATPGFHQLETVSTSNPRGLPLESDVFVSEECAYTLIQNQVENIVIAGV